MPKIKDITVTDYCNDIDQIGIICADMEKAQRAMLDVFGLVPEVNYEKLYDLLYRGGGQCRLKQKCAPIIISMLIWNSSNPLEKVVQHGTII